MKLIVLNAAELELYAAISWFDERQPGLGEKFSEAAKRLLSAIEENPLQFSPVPGSRHENQFRVGIIRKYSYSVYFTILEVPSVVVVFAVQHGRRNPALWRERLSDFEVHDE